MEHIIHYFSPEYSMKDDEIYLTRIREQAMEPPNTVDDKEFTQQEIQSAIQSFDAHKAPGEDGITVIIITRVFTAFPKLLTLMYNKYLKSGCFPKQRQKAVIIPIIKHGKEQTQEVTKYRPINLLNTGGKILEKLLIDILLRHAFSNNLMNKRQFGFIPQKSTAMSVKQFISKNIKGNTVIAASLDYKAHLMRYGGQVSFTTSRK